MSELNKMRIKRRQNSKWNADRRKSTWKLKKSEIIDSEMCANEWDRQRSESDPDIEKIKEKEDEKKKAKSNR